MARLPQATGLMDNPWTVLIFADGRFDDRARIKVRISDADVAHEKSIIRQAPGTWTIIHEDDGFILVKTAGSELLIYIRRREP